jgi:hypothetical protein
MCAWCGGVQVWLCVTDKVREVNPTRVLSGRFTPSLPVCVVWWCAGVGGCVTDDVLSELATSCPNLQSLTLAMCTVTSTGAQNSSHASSNYRV